MTTLVGREVWAVAGTLIHGTVEKHQTADADHLDIVTVKTEYGTRYLHPSQVKLSAKEVLPDVENEIEYWKDRLKEINALIEEDTE